MSDCPVPRLNLSTAKDLEIMTTVTELVREIINVEDRLPVATGRSRERLKSQKSDLEQKIEAQFDLIWSFKGQDKAIPLPGAAST